jgi:2-methylcitrate dehydratase PrpD
VHNPAPKDPEQAKFSIQFCLGLAAVTGGARVQDFSPARLQDPRILAWMQKVEVRSVPSLPVRARLTAYRPDGTTASVEPQLQSLGPSQVRAKFRDVAGPLLGSKATETLVAVVDRLEQEEDLQQLRRLLRRSVKCQDIVDA